MKAVRLWARAFVLRWLGYDEGTWITPSSNPGTTGYLASELQALAECAVPCGMLVEVRQRSVPEVEPGMVRIVIEVCR